jgi:putative hydrolase of the HAD superfamily
MNKCAIDWGEIQLVVFDVDGTLYDQGRLRRRMLLELIGHALATRSLTTVRTVRLYRRLREAFSEDGVEQFEDRLVAQTARDLGRDPAAVRDLVGEWMERRPLAHLGACRAPMVGELFDALRRHGKRLGILSDYPAHDKLRVLNLTAEFVVSATDEQVGVLKPSPRGLQVVMAAAGVSPAATLLIGDRDDRDGEAARRAGARALIRSASPVAGRACFATFADDVFRAVYES